MTDRELTALQETGKVTVVASSLADVLDCLDQLAIDPRTVTVTGTFDILDDQTRLDAADVTWPTAADPVTSVGVYQADDTQAQQKLNALCEQLLQRGYAVGMDLTGAVRANQPALHRRIWLDEDGLRVAMAMVPEGDLQHWPDPADKIHHVIKGLANALDLDLPWHDLP